jgi:DNA helicase-2/ATP-dependent DNA helicase PcrA
MKYLNRLFDEEGYMERARIESELLFQPVETLDRIRLAFSMIAAKSRSWVQVLKDISQLEIIFKGNKGETARIHFSTVHAAKGLEYDTVFMIDLYKGEFPGKNWESELEEERRLFFVGMTRARGRLYMVYPSKRAGKELEAGQFFKETKELLNM